MQDIGQLLINSQASFNSLRDLINGNGGGVSLAEITGMCLVALSLFRARQMADDRSHTTVGQVVSPLVIGGMFLAWGQTTGAVSESLALSGGALGYQVPQGSLYSQAVINAILSGVGVLGAISIFRGLLKWKAAGEGNHQGDPVWAGLWHILGGGIALNISDFIKMLGF